MSQFDDREKAQEAKFAHDAELRFRSEARRNKLLGLWAAELLGHEDPAAYAREVVDADFEEAGDEDVFRKVHSDLLAKRVDITEQEIREKMTELVSVARDQVLKES